ncbi:MAG: hypothetical protein AABZ05_01415 [Nitrospirota bacterium]
MTKIIPNFISSAPLPPHPRRAAAEAVVWGKIRITKKLKATL